MADYILSCSSTADLTQEQLTAMNVQFISFHFSMNGQDYYDDLGKSYPYEKYYADIVAGGVAKSSQINISEYVDYFTKFVEEGHDVVHLSLSSGISGTSASAKSAASIVNERYPERHVYVIDTLAACSGMGLMVDKAAELRDSGMSAEEVVNWLEANKKRLHHWFFSTDLTSFVRGGRISKASAVFGGALKICPLMNVDYEGKLVPRYKIRTKPKVIKAIVEQMELHAENGLDYADKVYIANSACYEDARAVADLIEARFPKMKGKCIINTIGTTIGAHTGVGTVALFFWGDERVD